MKIVTDPCNWSDIYEALEHFIGSPLHQAFVAHMEREERDATNDALRRSNTSDGMRIAQGRAATANHAKIAFEAIRKQAAKALATGGRNTPRV